MATKYISFEKYGPEYQQLWDTMCIIRDASELQTTSDKIKRYQSTYEDIEHATGVPWQMVAVMHIREAGVQDVGVWKGVLHNGEHIIGTGKKTTLVPANRGPFSSWREAAIDAIKEKGFDKIKEWPVSRMLWALEPFNGYGYRQKGLRSPYIWASTNHQQRGKYVRDHVFDASVMDSQVGCAALLRFLGVGQKKQMVATTAVATTIAAAGAAASTGYNMTALAIGGVALTGLIGYGVYRWYKNRKTTTNVK